MCICQTPDFQIIRTGKDADIDAIETLLKEIIDSEKLYSERMCELGEGDLLKKFKFKPFKEPGWNEIKEAFCMIGKRHMSNVDFIQQGVTGNFTAITAEHGERLTTLKKSWSGSIKTLNTSKMVIKKLFAKYKKN